MGSKRLLFILIFIFAGRALYAAVPTITSFSPSYGTVGTLVTIKGANLNVPVVFTIGGSTAVVVSNSGNKLVGMVMPGAVSGKIIITTLAGTATAPGNFTISTTKNDFTQQGDKLTGTGNAGPAALGSSIAISADGNTAIVGGVNDSIAPNGKAGMGAVWVFTRRGGKWQQQGTKLVGSGTSGAIAGMGSAVAISADGNTALVGGDLDSTRGAVWVFVRQDSTWLQQGGKLRGSGAKIDYQGASVALSADGNTALIAGNNDGTNSLGNAWIFTRKGEKWTQLGEKLTGTEGIGKVGTGFSHVALSADGKTAAIGAPFDDKSHGAVWVFTLDSGVWKQQGKKLVGTGNVGAAVQGISVSLSADGNTLLEGGSGDSKNQGAAWIFTRNNGLWKQQGAKLATAINKEQVYTGYSVALSADGNTAIIGGFNDNKMKGAAWVFTRSGSIWTQAVKKLVVKGNVGPSGAGFPVALSADGTTAFLGGLADNKYNGAAWVFKTGVNPLKTDMQKNDTITYTEAIVTPAKNNDTTTTITYISSDPSVAMITDGQIHLKGVGTTTIAGGGLSKTLTVTPATLVITPDSAVKIAGTVNPAFTLHYAGFINGDTPQGFKSQPLVTTTAFTLSPKGIYPVTVTGGSSSNYIFEFESSKLIVNGDDTIKKAEGDLLAPQVKQAISPNADGINDVLTITNVEKYPVNKVTLLNNGGDKIFEISGYDNVNKVFKGYSNITGKLQQPGTYFYLLQYTDGRINKTSSGYFVIKY